MPTKPRRPCSYPNCPKLTYARFCDDHKKQVNKNYEKYERKYKAYQRYGNTWKKIRDSFVKTHPFCKMCMDQYGILTKVEHVHHITPIAEGGTHNIDNLMPLCHSCHSKVHASRGDRWKN